MVRSPAARNCARKAPLAARAAMLPRAFPLPISPGLQAALPRRTKQRRARAWRGRAPSALRGSGSGKTADRQYAEAWLPPDCPPRPTKHLMADGACLLGTGAVQNEHRCAFVPRGPTAPAAGLVAATYASMLYGAIMHSGCVVACSAVAGEQSSLIEVTQLPCSWLQNCQDNDVFHGSITFAHSIRRLAPVWWVHVVRVWGLSGCWGV